MLIVLNLDITIKIFIQSALHLIRLLILQAGRQVNRYHISLPKFNVLRQHPVLSGQTVVKSRLIIVLVVKNTRLRIDCLYQLINVLASSLSHHVLFLLEVLTICYVQNEGLLEPLQHLLGFPQSVIVCYYYHAILYQESLQR